MLRYYFGSRSVTIKPKNYFLKYFAKYRNLFI